MDTSSRIRRTGYCMSIPARSRNEEIGVREAPEPQFEQEDVSLDGIVLDLSVEQQTRKKQDTVRAKTTSRGGYDRNGRRRRDERLYDKRRRRVLYAVPVMAFALIAVVMLWGPFANQPRILSAQQASAISENVQPTVVPFAGASDEKLVANYIETYKVASNRARVVTLEPLGVQARVLEVGRDSRGQPQLAKNSYDAGWYNASVLPGEAGAVVLSGACSGSVDNGVFHRLDELQKGAQVYIEKGDGMKVTYEVRGSETVAVDELDMAKVLAPTYGSTHGLSLVGCTGSYDVKTNDFAGRTVVYLVQI